MSDVSELTLLVLRVGFLALLWFFIFAIVFALRSDLFGQRARKITDQPQVAAAGLPDSAAFPGGTAPAAAPVSGHTAEPTVSSGTIATINNTSRLMITSGPRAGTVITLGSEPLTIGRSSDSGLVIRDDYTSTHHARLMLWNNDWMVQDLDSTNGTLLAGKRVSVPTPIPLDTPIKIGMTTFELRR
ncbi:FHA domain-containing protein [Homoserinimonas sp. OAct 916]|uniref:FHA domain-containing protein FhaB/FipA n=1 Tax=Homoserinimonas sp. OAct 916 TaxID=2211450 RepID=UPI000DBE370B|nr:FHA domain-containing protein [Homoserinimonas sp. OAct 916]